MCAMGLEKLTRLAKVDYGFPFDSNSFTDNSLYMPLIRIRDIKPAKASTYYEGEYCDRYVVRKGDILVGMDGEFNLERWNDRDGLLNQRILRIKAIDGLSDESYLYHLLAPLFKNIEKKVQGSSVKHLSAKIVENLYIPYVDFEEQVLIGKQLDTFTTLISNLESELDMRRKQYEHYRNQLLDFEGVEGVEWKTLGDVGEFVRGNGIQKKDFVEDGYGCIHYGQVYTQFGLLAYKTITRIEKTLYDKCRKAKCGDIVLATTSENLEDVAKPVIWLGDEEIAVSGDAFIYKHNQNPIFIGSQFLTDRFSKFKAMCAKGAKVIRITGDSMAEYKIALPSLEKQKEIAEGIKSFENLIQSLEQEIKLRKQQYEYYREKLLTFE